MLHALRAGRAAQGGPDLAAFEREMAQRLGVEHTVALSSGTAALHLALLALAVGPGDVVLVPTLSAAATANAVVYTGAEPVFVDCDPTSATIDVPLLGEALAALRRQGRHVGAVIPVDMFGSCADYTNLVALCDSEEVPVVEDAAQALGSSHRGVPAGAFGHAGAISFSDTKILTTTGGGMLVSADARLAARARHLAAEAHPPGAYHEHHDIGYSYRLSAVLAALGRAQLRRLDEMLARRRALRETYRKLFAQAPGVRVLADEDTEANCWLTTIVVDAAQSGWHAGQLGAHLAAHDIETRPIGKPMHLQPVFLGTRSALTGAAERLFDTGLSLPSGSALSDAQLARVCDAIDDFLDGR